MAVFHGKTGMVAFAGDLFKLQSWTLSHFTDTADTSAMGDTWESVDLGLEDFSASAEGLAETTIDYATNVLGAGATLDLETIDGSNKFSATAICTGVTETASIDDEGKISYSFVGNSAAGIVYS